MSKKFLILSYQARH